MSTLTTSVRAELAAAIRVVNVHYGELSEEQQANTEMVDMEPVEAALKQGDDDQALAAVADWSHKQLAAIREAGR